MNQTTTIKPKQIDLKQIKLKLVWSIVLSVLLILFVLYFVLPVMALRFVSWIVPFAICLIPFWFNPKAHKWANYIYLLLAAWMILASVFSSGVFNAKSYRNLIGTVESTNFSELVSPVNLDQVPIIDRAFASSLAEKKLGEDFALGSRVTLGTPTIQMVDNRLFWVVPLLHSGFFKWLSNSSNGTPGYIKSFCHKFPGYHFCA